MTGYQSKRAAAQDKLVVTDIDGHVVRDVRKPKKAQPAQKPVAWLEPEWGEMICPEIGFEATTTSDHPRDLCWIPLYPHQPQRTWVGLTEQDIDIAFDDTQEGGGFDDFARAIEAKLKDKNT